MGEVVYWKKWVSLKLRVPSLIPIPCPKEYKSRSCPKPYSSRRSNLSKFRLRASMKTNHDFSEISSKNKKGNKAVRRLIRISTAEGKWQGNWNTHYIFSLRDLHLQDLAEDGDTNTQVSVTLSVHKHAGFGLSVDGKITASFIRKCSNCSSPYCREIDTNFNVWVLPSSKDSGSTQLPEIGGDDPSVIYVKPGCEADLDSLVKDTIRLTTAVKETCSELCEKSELRVQHLSNQNSSSIDKRWSKLLELRNSIK